MQPLTSQSQPNYNPLDLYDTDKRGAQPPEYSNAEAIYRNTVLGDIQLAYNTREQPQMELNDRPYSLSYLTNRQQDMAYNPPKLNPTDSRIVTGVIHEKDNTIEQIIVDMNFQPNFQAINKDNHLAVDFATFATSLVKRALKRENFQAKIGNFSRVNISQGNAFLMFEDTFKFEQKKVLVNPKAPETQQRWTTILEKQGRKCESIVLPNTAVYMTNLLEPDFHKQDRIFVVMHIRRTKAEQWFGHFPRWQNVPLYPTNTVPPNTNGVWGDFYLQQPQKNYVEIILTQSEIQNDYNVLVNSVLMYPVQEENGKISGYPLTEVSPSGAFTITKWTNEKIPFYAYGRSVPSKNEVKEEVANEFMRIAVHKFRYSAFPSVGNNSDKVLPASIWNPAEVIPDLDAKNVSVLNPNGSLTQSDFSFYQMIMESIDNTSVSDSLEGQNQKDITATQYVDQKKADLKKLGITIDGTIEGLKESYWLYFWSELNYIDQKVRKYDEKLQGFVEDYDSFVSDEMIDGQPGQIHYHFQDDLSGLNPYEEFKKEHDSGQNVRHVYLNPKETKEMIRKMKDQIYCKVNSEPDGQNQSLLSILFNLLTQYSAVRGGPIPNLNYEYIDKVLDQNSGFETDKLFLPMPAQSMVPPEPAMVGPDGMPVPSASSMGGQPSPILPNVPKKPQNSVLANGI